MSIVSTESIDLKANFLSNSEECLKKARLLFPGIETDNWDNTESLSFIAKACYDAFSNAVNSYRDNGIVPLVAGTDPHNHDSSSTSLSAALSNVFGFTVSRTLEAINPKSVAVLKAMQPIASDIHQRGYCIFT